MKNTEKILAFDLGTGGIKAVLHDATGALLATAYKAYPTYYPEIGWHEQAPADWWDSLISCTHDLLNKSGIAATSIVCLALSGHSCGAVPIDDSGKLLREHTPIWSDMRAREQSERFLNAVPMDDWYRITGGDMPGTYAVFKIMWYQDHEPEMMRHVFKILGTKDYINYRLTGKIMTDRSYASSSGVYDLREGVYSKKLLAAAGVAVSILPEIFPSTAVVGKLTEEAAGLLHLSSSTRVICGGVDNACMALGSGGIENGRVYTNLGSSAWIAITTDVPLINTKLYPNAFAHILPNKYACAATIFSAGNALRWVRDTLCPDLIAEAAAAGKDPYDLMMALAATSPLGANRLIFNPTLAMGTLLDFSINTKGAFTGLDLRHTRADLIRAAVEGITLGLGWNFDELKKLYPLSERMLLVGGGSNSPFWMQVFADIYGMPIITTTVGQNAGALGAAATAAVGAGIWDDFSHIDDIHIEDHVSLPVSANQSAYGKLMEIYQFVARCQGEIGDKLAEATL
ncbi:MAG: pentose kinase [Clostridiales Family XIII bacterium]|jgi:xylulokinase|nr:pentose kinase [Clostridiales Family XIII bacterium]